MAHFMEDQAERAIVLTTDKKRLERALKGMPTGRNVQVRLCIYIYVYTSRVKRKGIMRINSVMCYVVCPQAKQ